MTAKADRKDVFTEGPWCVHAATESKVSVKALADSEILVQSTKNDTKFDTKLYKPEDAPWDILLLVNLEMWQNAV